MTNRDTGVKTDDVRSHARTADNAPDGDKAIGEVYNVVKGFKLTEKSR